MAKWTRERILREILRREAEGLKLHISRREGIDHALYQAGIRMFGSWRNALKAAGITPTQASLSGQWTPAKVVSVIRSLARKRRPLNRAELRKRHGYLVRAAHRHFGSWVEAVAAAGIDPALLNRTPIWTRERIIEAILARALDNAPLGSSSVRPRSLSEAAVRVFGSWRAALSAAGVQPTPRAPRTPSNAKRNDRTHEQARPGQVWTDQGVIDAIVARLREHKPMNAMAVREDHRSLYRGVERRFGNWRKSLLAAGLDPEEFQKSRGGRPGRR